MLIRIITLLRPNATVTLGDGYRRVTIACRYDESIANSIGTMMKGTGTAPKRDWSPKLDPRLLRSIARSGYFGAALR